MIKKQRKRNEKLESRNEESVQQSRRGAEKGDGTTKEKVNPQK